MKESKDGEGWSFLLPSNLKGPIFPNLPPSRDLASVKKG